MVEGNLIDLGVNRRENEIASDKKENLLIRWREKNSLFGATAGMYLTAGIALACTEVSLRYMMHLNPPDLEYFHIYKLPALTGASVLPGFFIGGYLGKKIRLGEFMRRVLTESAERLANVFKEKEERIHYRACSWDLNPNCVGDVNRIKRKLRFLTY